MSATQRGRRTAILLAILAIAGFTTRGAAFAATLMVPDGYSNIQAGINAAQPGDTVIVRNGTYRGNGNTNLDFGGKAITVQSESGPTNCTIDGEGMARGFYFHTQETENAVVSGFTITQGYAGNGQKGGAIACIDSSPTITNCILTTGRAESGAGIYCESSEAVISQCTILNNFADGDYSGYGGGIYVYASAPTITNCVLTGNKAKMEGGGIALIMSATPQILNCTLTNNTSTFGGGISSDSSSSNIANCVIGSNTGVSGGGMCLISSSPSITNCTFSNNKGSTGGAVSNDSSSPIITNSILWGDSPTELYATNGASTPVVTYSDVQGGCEGSGNVNSDPLFVYPMSNDYHLQKSSPCVNKGSSLPQLPATDRDGNPRIMNGSVDMGAYEYGIVVSVTATDALAAEPGTNRGKFTITRKGDVSVPVVVRYTVSGTATAGIDYKNLPGYLRLAAGRASGIITLFPLDDTIKETNETVTLTIRKIVSYTVGKEASATVTIRDNDR